MRLTFNFPTLPICHNLEPYKKELYSFFNLDDDSATEMNTD